MATQQESGQQVRFKPRRLGHANLFVGDLERSMQFYNQICGLQEVFREPAINGVTNLEGTINPEEAEEMLLAGYDPVQRERCLEKARVAAEVIYPTFGLFVLGSKDAELKQA